MDTTTVKAISIKDLDIKLNSKAGFSNKRRKEYTKLMIQALLSEGMTLQNQLRFCNAYVATGVEPVVKLLNSDKGKNWTSILFPIIKQEYFMKNVSNMKLRFFMELLSRCLHNFIQNNQPILTYCIQNIKDMEFSSKKKFRSDNITFFKECILNHWKSEKTIKNIESKKALEQLKEFVLLCLKEDKNSTIKNHPHFKEFGAWLTMISNDGQRHATQKDVTTSADTPSISTGNVAPEPQKVKNVDGVNSNSPDVTMVKLQTVIDLFEKKIIQKTAEINSLQKQIHNLSNQMAVERQTALGKKAELESKLEDERKLHNNAIKERDDKIKALTESLFKKESIINEQKAKLQEREILLKDNDIRFENQYKQKMTALGNKLKLSVSDLRAAIDDLSGDDRDFVETPFEDIIDYLKKEGVTL